MAYINKLNINGDIHKIGFRGPGTYNFTGDFIGHCNDQGDCSFTIPLDGDKDFSTGSVSYCKGYIFGVNGVLKYSNSSPDGLTDFKHSNFTISVQIDFNLINVYISNKSDVPTNFKPNTPYCVLIQSLSIVFS